MTTDDLYDPPRDFWYWGGKCELCWAENEGEGCDWAACGCVCHDDDDRGADDDD